MKKNPLYGMLAFASRNADKNGLKYGLQQILIDLLQRTRELTSLI
jgi:hypothetical protein